MAATQAPARGGGRVAHRQQQTTHAVARVDADEAVKRFSAELDRRNAVLAESATSLIDPARFKAVVLATFTRTPGLWDCDPITVARAVVEAAQAGLEPTGALGGGYLVPYWNGKTQRREAQFIIGYTGQVKLARRSGEISRVEARVVHAQDEFDFGYGLEPFLHHKPALDVPEDAHNPITHAYAVMHYRNGERQFDVMSAAELLAIKARSKSRDKDGHVVGPWVTDEAEMFKKTVLRRLMKLAPLTVEAQRVLDAEDDIELERSARARQLAPTRPVTPSRIAARVMGAPHAAEPVSAPAGTGGPAVHAPEADASPVSGAPDAPVAAPPEPGEVEPIELGDAAPSPEEEAEVAGELCESTSDPAMPPVVPCSLLAGHLGKHVDAEGRTSWPNRGGA